MSRLRFSLFSKIILWVFLNLLLVAAILLLIFNLNFRLEPRSPFFGRSVNRFEAVTRLIISEIDVRPRAERDAVLKKYSEAYHVEFFLFDNQGRQMAGREISLPDKIFAEVSHPEPPPPPPPPPPPGVTLPVVPREPPRGLPPPGPPPSTSQKTTNPTRYWMIQRIMIFDPDRQGPVRARLLIASDSFSGNGLFFDPTPYLAIAGVVSLVSILFWFPFVRRLTRAIARVTNATEQIAEERFDVRVDEARTDELGRLGKSINHLAERLSGYVTGQRRFLGDISHELNSPLARMQFALSILEDRVDDANRRHVEDVKEEVELMAKLVSELLIYAKAGIKGLDIKLEPVRLRPLVERVIKRETTGASAEISLDIDDRIEVLAQPELLSRAVANVLRNAARYAGSAGEIKVFAARDGGHVRIVFADSGAGVPEAELEKMFDPFHRIEYDRARATGGTGLGLAIVKSCVAACDGQVSARNRTPHGFEVTFSLHDAGSSVNLMSDKL